MVVAHMIALILAQWSMKFENGKLKSVKGNADHPMTRGGLCVKLKDYEKRHYHPDRILYPLRRTGSKGSRQFERISLG